MSALLRERLAPSSKLECKICWWVYDPALGDPEGHVEPGTAFLDLPAHFRCPRCDAAAEQFLVLL
jgi:rubredoxin